MATAPSQVDTTNIFERAHSEPLTSADFQVLRQAREQARRDASGAKHETVVGHEGEADLPVKARAEQEEGGVRRVVAIAVDDSEYSDKAVQWAVNNLLNVDTDLALLINVRAPVLVPGAFGMAYMDPTDYIIKADEEARKESHDLLRYYIRFMHKHKPKLLVRGIAMRGDARDEICRKVKEVEADVLVMGSRGQGAFRRMVLGSVSDYCIHHVACPVLIIKEPHQPTEKGRDKDTTPSAGKEAAPTAPKDITPQIGKDTTSTSKNTAQHVETQTSTPPVEKNTTSVPALKPGSVAH